MKEKIIYITKCRYCGNDASFILRSNNVNPMSDISAENIINNYKDGHFEFNFCEKCKLVTKQEIVAFDY